MRLPLLGNPYSGILNLQNASTDTGRVRTHTDLATLRRKFEAIRDQVQEDLLRFLTVQEDSPHEIVELGGKPDVPGCRRDLEFTDGFSDQLMQVEQLGA